MNVRTLCLAILHFGEVTGYEIKKLAEDGIFAHFIEASFGAIYPALSRMSNEGLVVWRTEVQEGKPSRKVYSITDVGRKEFIENLYEAPKPDKHKSEFLLMMLCSNILDKNYVTGLIDDRINGIQCEIKKIIELERLAFTSGESTKSAEAFIIGYGNHMANASIEYMKKNRHLIEEQSFATQSDK